MSEKIQKIQFPVAKEIEAFRKVFDSSLSGREGLLGVVLDHVRARGGKRMRPLLTLLVAKALGGDISDVLLHGACALELLHTASLVHDDVVDESDERRGQPSVNTSFNNKTAVLCGDFILSTALREVAQTCRPDMVDVLAELGQELSQGELIQLSAISEAEISEAVYFDIIRRKTASLFDACCRMACLNNGVGDDVMREARLFGENIGLIFQIRDDIFDYSDSSEIGKPTGNDMREGKLTLPLIHALLTKNDAAMLALAHKVKSLSATDADIHALREFTIANHGIEYAESKMDELRNQCLLFLEKRVEDEDIKMALKAYINYVIGREK